MATRRSSGVALTPFGVDGVAHLFAALGASPVDDDAGLAAVVGETGGSAVRIVEVARRFAAAEPSGVTLAATMLVVCPYKGLEHFDASDASRYHGRRELVAEILEKLRTNRFVGVAGASGSGKSSLLRAGVLPSIAGATVVRTPGEHPLESLDEARRALGPGPGVLAFDQLEECFTLCGDATERVAFLDALTEPGPHGVVVAVRGDFYAHFAVHPATARALERSTVLVGPMTQHELEDVIERPALDAGLRLQDGLVDLVVSDVLDEPGGLPLLSHAMRETWRRHRGGVLTIADYRSSGGGRGAIARFGRPRLHHRARRLGAGDRSCHVHPADRAGRRHGRYPSASRARGDVRGRRRSACRRARPRSPDRGEVGHRRRAHRRGRPRGADPRVAAASRLARRGS